MRSILVLDQDHEPFTTEWLYLAFLNVIQNDRVIMLYLAGIIITFFLAITLLAKKDKTASDHVLAAWLCGIGLHLFLFYWQIIGEIFAYPHFLGILIPLPLLHGPFLYIYTLTVTRDNHFKKEYWLHFIPAVAAFVALSSFFGLTGPEKIAVYKHHGAGFEIHSAVLLISAILSGFAYVLFSLYELKKYRRRITEEFSNTERINLNWLRYLVFGILAIWIIIMFNGGDALIYGVVVVYVFLLGFFGIKNMGIFTYRQVIVNAPGKAQLEKKRVTGFADGQVKKQEKNLSGPALTTSGTIAGDKTLLKKEPVLVETSAQRTKYEKSGLQKEMADKIYGDLCLLMETKKIFKKDEISLGHLAQQLDTHPNNLSQVINTYENKSFYDYINSLRIEEFKALIMLPENSRYTLLSLAFECGFNSKTAFNRNFKKFTGQSPSAYLKQVNIQLVGE